MLENVSNSGILIVIVRIRPACPATGSTSQSPTQGHALYNLEEHGKFLYSDKKARWNKKVWVLGKKYFFMETEGMGWEHSYLTLLNMMVWCMHIHNGRWSSMMSSLVISVSVSGYTSNIIQMIYLFCNFY